jgi:hypothetical protein
LTNVRNLQESKQQLSRLTEKFGTWELVLDEEEFLRRTGWDPTKNIGAIMVQKGE